ncbi:MAG TPA: D-alanine--D-alanine ligase [Gemmatimonadaceae bacterium]|nr:D-alanine--D-alanine ligase [Gemmatimonadaceae bacterium]
MKITVLMGGTSAERDVSLASGVRIAQALRGKGHQVISLDTARGVIEPDEEAGMLRGVVVKTAPPELEQLEHMARQSLSPSLGTLPAIREVDVVFLALHGGQGEDGTLQALLDMAGVRYTGSGHLGSALAMDKDLSKHLFRANGVTTADWMMIRQGDDFAEGERRFDASAVGLPVVVKPSKQGSTVGLSVVKERRELGDAIREALRYDDEVMLEQFVPGRELTVSVLGSRALPVGEIFPKHEIYDYECKYTQGMAVEEFPAQLSPSETAEIQRQALAAFRALKLGGYARVDFRMSSDGRFYCLEANTLPGMTGTSLLPQAAAADGLPFAELCERIAQLALEPDQGGRT